jgi:hypothetical protein
MPKVQRYVSTELTHFVGRGKAPEDQYALLVDILRGGWLTHPPHNPTISGNLFVKPDASVSNNDGPLIRVDVPEFAGQVTFVD